MIELTVNYFITCTIQYYGEIIVVNNGFWIFIENIHLGVPWIQKEWFLENVCTSIARSSVLTTEVLTTEPIFTEFKVNTESYFIKSTCMHENRLKFFLKTNQKPPTICFYKTRLQRRLDQTCVKHRHFGHLRLGRILFSLKEVFLVGYGIP